MERWIPQDVHGYLSWFACFQESTPQPSRQVDCSLKVQRNKKKEESRQKQTGEKVPEKEQTVTGMAMTKKQKLELALAGKEERPRLEPRILLEDQGSSYPQIEFANNIR